MTLSDDHFSSPPPHFSFPKIQTNPGYYTTVIPNEGIQHRIPDTGYPFKVYLNPCSHSIHSNAFSCALAAKPLSQPKCILLPWISWHKLVREWRMQSVPSHFSTCTNTRDLETLHKFLLTSYRQSLNVWNVQTVREITRPFTNETSNAPSNKISPSSAAIKALLLSQRSRHDARELFQQPPALCQAAPWQNPTEQDRALQTGSEKPWCWRIALSWPAGATRGRTRVLGETCCSEETLQIRYASDRS